MIHMTTSDGNSNNTASGRRPPRDLSRVTCATDKLWPSYQALGFDVRMRKKLAHSRSSLVARNEESTTMSEQCRNVARGGVVKNGKIKGRLYIHY